jgi:oligoendopeptidase F
MDNVAVQSNGVCWDLTSYFPSFDGPELPAFKQQLAADIAQLAAEAAALAPLDSTNAAAWEDVIVRAEDISARMAHLSSYIGNLSSAHADVEAYQQESARMSSLIAQNEKIDTELVRAVKEASDADFEALLGREKLAGADYFLRRLRQRSQWTMGTAEEQLAAELGVDGIHAWGRLYDTLTGKLTFEMRWPDGRVETLPISQWRALLGDPDRAVGKAAFDGGNRAWAGIEDSCAAALNAIAGTRLTLYKRRGLGDDFLRMALFGSAIERESLEAMYSAIRRHIELARDIFRVKGKAMGRTGIAFWEREAPLPAEDNSRYSWEEGSAMVARAFRNVYPNLADYYDSFLRQGWMESQVRPGKRPGAYCTGSPVTGEQRVYMTFNGSINEVGTVAHELGHAFHSHLLKDFRPVQMRYPMTLAETASIFAELILAEGVYEDESVSDAAKLLMLDTDLSGAAILLLDIFVRFEFERKFYTERMSGEVSVSRLKELMVETQREVFGDALEPGGEDPYFWASKLHFYISRTTFYNFPYTFGFLLARALFARFKQQGDSFLPQYEDFLRLTGSATVEDVVQRSIGGDTTDPEFWSASIESLREPLHLFKELLGQGSGTPA